jgi:hypothetical protein
MHGDTVKKGKEKRDRMKRNISRVVGQGGNKEKGRIKRRKRTWNREVLSMRIKKKRYWTKKRKTRKKERQREKRTRERGAYRFVE